jgi:hypothetical protein
MLPLLLLLLLLRALRVLALCYYSFVTHVKGYSYH